MARRTRVSTGTAAAVIALKKCSPKITKLPQGRFWCVNVPPEFTLRRNLHVKPPFALPVFVLNRLMKADRCLEQSAHLILQPPCVTPFATASTSRDKV
jgi:hypothetical protein